MTFFDEPRIALTFRELQPTPNTNNIEQCLPPIINPRALNVPEPSPSNQSTFVPPIHRPNRTCSNNKTRMLLLTVSILSTFPTGLVGLNLDCHKIVMYKITDFHKYVHLFDEFDYVILSAGINDISRYNFTAGHLTYVMKRMLNDICRLFPETMFVFRTLLPTEHPWLNFEVDRFNFSMLLQSKSIFNFIILDTYSVHRNPRLIDPRGNGIHITH